MKDLQNIVASNDRDRGSWMNKPKGDKFTYAGRNLFCPKMEVFLRKREIAD